MPFKSFKFRAKYFIYAAMILYILYLAISIFQIHSMLDFSREYLDKTRDDSRNLRSRINELQNIIPGLLSSPKLTYAAIDSELKRQEAIRDKVMDSLKNLWQGNPKTLDKMNTAMRKMRLQVRELAAALESNSSYDVAMQSFNVEIMPYVRPILALLNEIDVENQTMAQNIQTKVAVRMNLAIIFSLLFGGLIVVMLIFTDRKEQSKNREIAYRERLFNQLSQNTDEVYIVAANSDDFAYVSPNSEKLLNIKAEELQTNPASLYPLFNNPKISDWLKDALDGAPETDDPEEQTFSIPALQKSFRLRVYPIGVVSGKNERFIISIRDQTTAMRHQEALSVALENAHAASAAKSSFLSHISHEIRTPMNAIIGMTTIAISRLNDRNRVQDCLGKIAESSRHLLGLINDVLDMSKIESGKLAINHEEFNLHQCIGNINNIVQSQARQRQLQFDILLEGVEEEDLIGDSLRLNQILLNLLSNAYKFTPPGGNISLRIQQLSKNKNSVRLRFIVTDTGIGMSKEFLERIYQPFEQAHANTAAKYGGTGLGMPITANIVSLMGGIIQVESHEGAGTKFTVELPFGLTGKNSRNYNLPRLKILVVDDDPGTCEHATLLLEKMGLKTRWVTSGSEAVQLAAEAHASGDGFDVCLVDWKMPNMDGAETARRIREVVGDDVLIIIISAYDWTPIEEEARKAGVNDFIAKPFFSSSLYDALLSATRKLGEGVTPAKNEDGHIEYNFSGKRVLLVEDNEFNREIGQEFLEMVHVEVDNAENGQEAVDKVLSSPAGYYDLVLMDVQMPVMNGYDATRAIRASAHPEAASLVILAMTANAFSEDVAKAVAAGMNGHLAKPIDVNDLYRLLATHLSKKTAPPS